MKREERPKRTKQNSKKSRNKEFARVTYIFVLLFLALMGYLVYFNLVRAQKIVNNPHNERQNNFAQQVVRGNITDKDGVVLAETQTDEAGNESRVYPYGDVFAHVIGYDSSLGKTGLESVENFELLTSNAVRVFPYEYYTRQKDSINSATGTIEVAKTGFVENADGQMWAFGLQYT